MELKLRKFDMRMIKDDSVVVMLSKRGCGKSILIKDMMSYHTDIPLAMVISPTEEANGFFGDFVPNIFLHDEYDPKRMESLINRQKRVIRQIKREKSMYGTCNIDPRAFIIMDDCMYNAASWNRDSNIRYLFLNGRHVKVLTVVSTQYAHSLPPTLRTNIDYIFILRENVLKNRKIIFENFAGMFQSFELFCTVLDQTTENYECLVVCNKTQSNKLEDCVFWYKANGDPAPFRTCDERYWALDRQCSPGKDEGEDEEEVFDLDKLRKGARKMNVKVVKN